jgi:pentatricopeptide repeat protein
LCKGIKGPKDINYLYSILELYKSNYDNIEEKTTVMYNCLIEACVLTKNLGLGKNIFEEFKEMKSTKEKPDLVTYNILLKG